MTWKEFKDFIDTELQKRGRSENIELVEISIHWPVVTSIVDIELGENSDELWISDL